MIRAVELDDAEAIVQIYNYYIQHTTVSFEEALLTTSEMRARIERITAEYPWLVYIEKGRLIGYVYASNWRARSAYRHTVETSIYVDIDHGEKGVGGQLYSALKAVLKEKKFKALIACITLPNDKSVSFHEKMGFQKVGIFQSVGYKFDQWLDAGYWQYRL